MRTDFFDIMAFDAAADGFKATAALHASHPVYEGHFPGRPVVPGVFTLALVRECASRAAGRALEYAEIRECKFLSALLPCEGLQVTLDFSFPGGQNLSGTVRRGGETVLKLKAVMR